ncbi:MAG: DUF1080 domain-containing protein [Planctomycetota bacterium]|nr:MAG: DUF1080 domain-containing protein [Planctomycetota bacterium]GDY10501.1 hypothetical protein LBMAG52_39890 [Planctomycetia bacterium]
MRSIILPSVICAIFLFGTSAEPLSAQSSRPAGGHTSCLFNGKSLDGWAVENGAKVEIQDGNLLLKDGDGWLRSHHVYADFQLHVEWKALKAETYDAGIYLRAQRDGVPFPKKGYQANLLQGKEGNIGSLPGAESKGLVKPGEWNAFDITVIGDRVTMVINGCHAYSVAGIKEPVGHIGIQVEVPKGGQFLLRNLCLTELGFASMFNGQNFAGWEGAGQPADTCWKIENGLLVCTGQKGPWLRTCREYDNFSMRFDYLLAVGGNSGVYVRVPQDGNHHRENDTKPPAGFEVQVLDDAAKEHAKLKDYQYSASIYDIAGANPRNTRPPGEWNTLEIVCDGDRVITRHNGVTVTDINGESHPLIKLRQLNGFLGLQNHSTEVKFRNLRIGPPVR